MQAMRCFFAPMEGITGALFRRTHRRFFPGVDRYFMPFLSPSQHHVFTRRELRDILPEQDGDLDAVPQLLTRSGADFLWAAGELARMGYRVGILDADITGPSIPKCFGMKQRALSDENGIYPVETKTGIKVMSINLLLEEETSPVVWRGPVIAGAIKQFWTDVIWGNVDYMFVDMPPGTGDAPLTVFQSLPLDGILIVTSPQELVGMIVSKAVEMAKMMDVPVLGLVENMSYVKCPDCGREIHVFGESHIDEVAAKYGLKVLGKLPMEPKLAAACDRGAIELFEGDWLEPTADLIEGLPQKEQ